MQLTTHPKEWVQYTSQLQFMVQSCRNKNGVGISTIHDKLHGIYSLELVNS